MRSCIFNTSLAMLQYYYITPLSSTSPWDWYLFSTVKMATIFEIFSLYSNTEENQANLITFLKDQLHDIRKSFDGMENVIAKMKLKNEEPKIAATDEKVEPIFNKNLLGNINSEMIKVLNDFRPRSRITFY